MSAPPNSMPPRVFHTQDQASRSGGWRTIRRAGPEDRINLTIALRHNGADALKAKVAAVSTPGSPLYGKHLSRDEVDALTAPAHDAVHAVARWARAAGAAPAAVEALLSEAQHPTLAGVMRDVLVLSTTADVADKLLGAKYQVVEHASVPGLQSLRTASFALPSAVVEHVRWVGPTVEPPLLRSVRGTHVADATGMKSPRDLRDMYGVPQELEGTPDVGIGIVAFFKETFGNLADVASFIKQYGVESHVSLDVGQPGPQARRLAAGDKDACGSETCLDLEVVLGVAPGLKTRFYYYPGLAPYGEQTGAKNEPFLRWLRDTVEAKDADLPSVYSISYSDWEASVPAEYAHVCEDHFQRLAARGVTVVVASGDAGVEGAQALPREEFPLYHGHCETGDAFIPDFPASSPHVLTVGALNGLGKGVEESAAELSGGGFSNVFSVPAWQKAAVDGFLAKAKADARQPALDGGKAGVPQRYNVSGRGIPDVALVGENFLTVEGGETSPADGTSASTPLMAALVGLLNAERRKANLPNVGFLNPLLYTHSASIFSDITTGHNPGCGTDGFFAVQGWDPVTGLGSPKFAALKEVVMAAATATAATTSSSGAGGAGAGAGRGTGSEAGPGAGAGAGVGGGGGTGGTGAGVAGGGASGSSSSSSRADTEEEKKSSKDEEQDAKLASIQDDVDDLKKEMLR